MAQKTRVSKTFRLKNTFFLSLSGHLLLIFVFLFTFDTKIEKPSRKTVGFIEVVLKEVVKDGASELIAEKLRGGRFDQSGGITMKRPSERGALGPTPKRNRFFEIDERKPSSTTLNDSNNESEPPSKTGSVVQDSGEEGFSEILHQIQQKIEKAKYYPLLAKRKNIEGSPKIEFKIKEDGNLAFVRIQETSGDPLLDDAAIQTVQQASPYPFYPDTIALNIHYSLSQ